MPIVYDVKDALCMTSLTSNKRGSSQWGIQRQGAERIAKEEEEEEEEEEELYKNVSMTSPRHLQDVSKTSPRRLQDVSKASQGRFVVIIQHSC